MNVLLVLAHAEPRSFNGALRDAVRRVVSDDAQQALLAQWRARLRGIAHEQPQPFRHLAAFPTPAMRDHA